MYRSAIRAAPRRSLPSRNLNGGAFRRFQSTAAPLQHRRGWANRAARWGLAIGAVYYYNTSNVFAEEPDAAIHRIGDSIHAAQDSRELTVDAIVEEKRQRVAQQEAELRKNEQEAKAALAEDEQGESEDGEAGIGGLEDDPSSQGAFNPETGEINWECSCLGGMAHGPCGEEFRAAFSCFVYSNEEPKGVECIEKFKGMQDCFRQHPEIYGAELEDDEDEVEAELHARENATPSDEPRETPSVSSTEETLPPVEETAGSSPDNETPKEAPKELHRDSRHTEPGNAQKAGDKGEELVPRAAYDATPK